MTHSKGEAGGDMARRQTNEIPRFIFSLPGQSTRQKEIKEGRKGGRRKRRKEGFIWLKFHSREDIATGT